MPSFRRSLRAQLPRAGQRRRPGESRALPALRFQGYRRPLRARGIHRDPARAGGFSTEADARDPQVAPGQARHRPGLPGRQGARRSIWPPPASRSLLKQGVDAETGKKISRLIKDSKLKVQASIQGEKVRVSGKQARRPAGGHQAAARREAGLAAAIQQLPRLRRYGMRECSLDRRLALGRLRPLSGSSWRNSTRRRGGPPPGGPPGHCAWPCWSEC